MLFIFFYKLASLYKSEITSQDRNYFTVLIDLLKFTTNLVCEIENYRLKSLIILKVYSFVESLMLLFRDLEF